MKLFITLLLFSCALTAVGQGFGTYTNERFGFSVRYPKSFVPQPEPTNGDGREFVSQDGTASLTASGRYNDGDNIKTMYDDSLEATKGTVGYTKLTRNWFIITSDNINGETSYHKEFVGKKSSAGFYFVYPTSQKAAYSSIVTAVEKSFRTGNLGVVDQDPIVHALTNRTFKFPSINTNAVRETLIVLLFALAGAVAFLAYFAPTFVAYRRHHNDKLAILVFNIFFGWFAWIWALTGNVERKQEINVNIAISPSGHSFPDTGATTIEARDQNTLPTDSQKKSRGFITGAE